MTVAQYPSHKLGEFSMSSQSGALDKNNRLPVVRNDSLVSLVELKILTQRMLPRNSFLRTLILSEQDYLPRVEARAKVEVFAKLLYEEVRGLK